ncbi:leucine-rich repeat domain-containing protein [Wenzhouxiangella sp. EGI_FJ10409]|uniref:hypothetical protein n=1 Tax=Wenzhouxiangella sp. EGI_FJ10409 TaxID=3243767 RepID=UPI0035D8C837
MTKTATLLLTAVLTSATANAQIAQDEREALMRFYYAAGGDNWAEDANWLGQPGTECNWFGVHCAAPAGQTPFVIRLVLPDNDLAGGLPDSLAELDRLETLALGGNQLSGTVPADLWALPSLQTLDLNHNLLSGQTPASILASGAQQGTPLTSVDLSGNQLTGFDSGAVPEPPLTPEIELRLDDNLIDYLPPPAWRATGTIRVLSMSGNRISGSVDLSDAWPGLEWLDLSDNAISAVLATQGDGPTDLSRLALAGNGIDDWPELLPTLDSLSELDLSDNALAGELPEWFDQLDLDRLDLDHNRLTGPIADVFQGMDLDGYPIPSPPFGESGLHLHLANNSFSGPLPDIDFVGFNRPQEAGNSEFGLDLCFNDIDMPGDAVLDAIAPVHRGQDLAACLKRSQATLGPDISGSWYAPSRSGEGTTMMMLDDGRLLQYWFTFGAGEGLVTPRQRWFVGLTEPASTSAEFRPLITTSGGRFGMGLADGESNPSSTWIRQNRIDQDTLHFLYDYRGGGICITGGCSVIADSDRFDQTRLSRLAGTTCDTQSPFQQYAGAWYNPERPGEGFIVEVLPEDRRMVIYWFTHTPDETGQQAWMTGDGQFQDPNLISDPPPPHEQQVDVLLAQPQGAYFGAEFESSDVEVIEWGELNIQFNDENTGHVYWDSTVDGYGSGDYPIERLARPMLAECPQGETQ